MKLNWKLILGLSVFGLVMAVLTVYVIPFNHEFFYWIPAFLLYGFLIAKLAPGKYFLHGFLTSLVNCFWITSIHVIMAKEYIERHPDEMKMMADWPMHDHPRRWMLIMGPAIGIACGLIVGGLSWLFAKAMKKN
jgi:hypothetical protein